MSVTQSRQPCSESHQQRGVVRQQVRIIAIPTGVAEAVRSSGRAPVYGHPAYSELGADPAPCRHCLRLITPAVDRRILLKYHRFTGGESLPLPGPVFIHAEACERYIETAGFPDELRSSPRTLEGYARGRRLLAQRYVADGRVEMAIEQLFALPDVDYIQVNSTTAGCFTFRIEREQSPITQNPEN